MPPPPSPAPLSLFCPFFSLLLLLCADHISVVGQDNPQLATGQNNPLLASMAKITLCFLFDGYCFFFSGPNNPLFLYLPPFPLHWPKQPTVSSLLACFLWITKATHCFLFTSHGFLFTGQSNPLFPLYWPWLPLYWPVSSSMAKTIHPF